MPRQVRNAQIASYPSDSGKVVNAVWAERFSMCRLATLLMLWGTDRGVRADDVASVLPHYGGEPAVV